MEKEFHELHREIWSVLKAEVMKGYAQSSQSGGGRLMSRLTLLSLQLLVAVVALALWHVLTTVPCSAASCCRRSSSPIRSMSPVRL